MIHRKTIGIFAGRFQLPHKGHKYVYDRMLNSYIHDAYIITSDIYKEDDERYPFQFHEKKKLLTYSGIPEENILLIKEPYKQKELYEIFDKDTVQLIYFVGQKDASRLTGGKYFLENKSSQHLLPYSQNAYVEYIDNYYSYVRGKDDKRVESATDLRKLYKTTKNKDEEIAFIKGLYNVTEWDDICWIRSHLNNALKSSTNKNNDKSVEFDFEFSKKFLRKYKEKEKIEITSIGDFIWKTHII